MLKKLPLLLLIISCYCVAQDKIKGSRNVKTEQYDLSSFHSIEASGEFKIEILRGSRPQVEIKADDNLHDFIKTDVVDGILYIKPFKEFAREKSQELKITYADTLKRIMLEGKVEFSSLQDLNLEDFRLETSGDSKAYITLKAKNFDLIHRDGAKAELNITSENVNFQLNQSSDLKALVNASIFNVDIYEKASARIEGEITELNLRADQSSKFDGENLSSIKAEVLSQGNSEVRVNVSDTLNVRAKGKSEIDVYNKPVVNLLEFEDEAVIAKKEFGKGIFN
ncbi:GIN domain-containing protein [Christiangramia sabulilitoris]|uniref:Putative auto-transporter adhesin head GIN domain-containing protein n=1 Tax=Christiangramia sabulilitoris TaxID=2583991 RepID=A0A550I6Z3_9FLAO|nr:DUF2807 domain-containing protein [Christiangramia sabulilitoris]TRO66739.1 hypothetical protein FGM01_02290 [Christiangramia sabulilitoris]